jgi:hypothetical protein
MPRSALESESAASDKGGASQLQQQSKAGTLTVSPRGPGRKRPTTGQVRVARMWLSPWRPR